MKLPTLRRTKKIAAAVFLLLLGVTLFAAGPRGKPAWVDSPFAVYPEDLFVAAVGSGRDRVAAEAGALAALAAYFKQSVSSVVTVVDSEYQANGRSSSQSYMSQTIEAVSALDTLIGAEIKNAWYHRAGKIWFAVAVMEKAECAGLYAEELNKTLAQIVALISVPAGGGFESAVKCHRALPLLGRADVFALVLAMLGGPNRREEVSRLAARTAAALTEAKAVPVDVQVRGDHNDRIRAAFSSAFAAEGFKTGGRNSRFALVVNVTFTPAVQGPYFSTRYTIDAVLRDTKTGAALFSYNAADRELHPAAQEDAYNRALIACERQIAGEFPKILRDYLNAKD